MREREIPTMLMVWYIILNRGLGVALAVVSSMRTTLGSIFTAVLVTTYTNKIPSKINEIILARLIYAGLPSSSITQVLKVASDANQAVLEDIRGFITAILKVANEIVATAHGQSHTYAYYTAFMLSTISVSGSNFTTRL
ncbi:trichothecene efflux pump [Penicillium lividum]|nr:trichothecene efflux pump [Penicillium lividum]